MMMEFCHTSHDGLGNIEVSLLFEETGYEIDRFYTSDRVIQFNGVISLPNHFEALEDALSKPTIGGALAKFHPYWKEREDRRQQRSKRNG